MSSAVTQETKLGLVIGGAFILCFSLILSHAEDSQAVESELATLALTSQAPPGFGEQASEGMISLEDLLAPGRRARRQEPLRTATAPVAQAIPDGPGPHAAG